MTRSPAERYHRTRRVLFFAEFFVQVSWWLGIYISGVASGVVDFVRSEIGAGWVGCLAYLGLLFSATTIVLLPFDILRGLWLEKKYLMSVQSTVSWWMDHLKKVLLGAALFTATVGIFYVLVAAFSDRWWLFAAVLSVFFSALLTALFPVLLVPLFYRQKPLPPGPLADEIRSLCVRCGLKPLDTYEIELSKKTVRANAAVVGYGRTRRIIVSDTLLKDFTDSEIRMVIAHEIGHHVKRHMTSSLVMSAAMTGFGLFLFQIAFAPQTLRAFDRLPLFLAISSVANLLATPLFSGLSRSHEREADAYALDRIPDMTVFEGLMHKLSERNLANPDPPKWEEWFFYTHPSAENRIRDAKRSCGRGL